MLQQQKRRLLLYTSAASERASRSESVLSTPVQLVVVGPVSTCMLCLCNPLKPQRHISRPGREAIFCGSSRSAAPNANSAVRFSCQAEGGTHSLNRTLILFAQPLARSLQLYSCRLCESVTRLARSALRTQQLLHQRLSSPTQIPTRGTHPSRSFELIHLPSPPCPPISPLRCQFLSRCSQFHSIHLPQPPEAHSERQWFRVCCQEQQEHQVAQRARPRLLGLVQCRGSRRQQQPSQGEEQPAAGLLPQFSAAAGTASSPCWPDLLPHPRWHSPAMCRGPRR